MQPEVRMPELKAAADNVKMKPMKCCNRAPLGPGQKLLRDCRLLDGS
jgi:hypothetical protein